MAGPDQQNYDFDALKKPLESAKDKLVANPEQVGRWVAAKLDGGRLDQKAKGPENAVPGAKIENGQVVFADGSKLAVPPGTTLVREAMNEPNKIVFVDDTGMTNIVMKPEPTYQTQQTYHFDRRVESGGVKPKLTQEQAKANIDAARESANAKMEGSLVSLNKLTASFNGTTFNTNDINSNKNAAKNVLAQLAVIQNAQIGMDIKFALPPNTAKFLKLPNSQPLGGMQIKNAVTAAMTKMQTLANA